MSPVVAILIGAVVGFLLAQSLRLTSTQNMAIAAVIGAVGGFLGNLLLGWLGGFLGNVAVVAVVAAAAVWGLRQAGVLKA